MVPAILFSLYLSFLVSPLASSSAPAFRLAYPFLLLPSFLSIPPASDALLAGYPAPGIQASDEQTGKKQHERP